MSKKDFQYRIKICRKEAKESRLWLRLATSKQESEPWQKKLIEESLELTKIFGSMVTKYEKK